MGSAGGFSLDLVLIRRARIGSGPDATLGDDRVLTFVGGALVQDLGEQAQVFGATHADFDRLGNESQEDVAATTEPATTAR